MPPDRAALLLAGLLVAYSAAPPTDADRTKVKVMDALAHSVRHAGSELYRAGSTWRGPSEFVFRLVPTLR